MVTVPLIVPDTPALRKDPVVAYMPDLFTRPTPLRRDVILNIAAEFPVVSRMLACHRSQVFEWLAYEGDILSTVPEDEGERQKWAQEWFAKHIRPRSICFQDELIARVGSSQAEQIEFIEMFGNTDAIHRETVCSTFVIHAGTIPAKTGILPAPGHRRPRCSIFESLSLPCCRKTSCRSMAPASVVRRDRRPSGPSRR